MDIRTDKILNAIIFFANKEVDKSITRLKLMKLLWLSDRIHLNKYGRLILKDKYNALPNGPVPSSTLNYSKISVKGYHEVVGKNNIIPKREFNAAFFSKSDIEIMELAWNEFGGLTASRLRNLSHEFPEWIRYKDNLEDKNQPNSYDIVIEDLFEKPSVTQYNKLITEEDIKVSRNSFRVHESIQSSINS